MFKVGDKVFSKFYKTGTVELVDKDGWATVNFPEHSKSGNEFRTTFLAKNGHFVEEQDKDCHRYNIRHLTKLERALK